MRLTSEADNLKENIVATEARLRALEAKRRQVRVMVSGCLNRLGVLIETIRGLARDARRYAKGEW